MLLAAGLGTRLKPFTNQYPKALATVNGKSLLQRNILYLQQAGIKKVVVNVHHFASQIINAMEENNGWGSEIIISDETDAVLETGGGLKKAATHLQHYKNFVLMNTDVLTDMNLNNMISFHETKNVLATLAVTQRKTSRYFLFDENDNLCGWKNIKTGEKKPAQLLEENLREKAFSGIHVINSEIFSLMQRNGKFSMVDVYLDLMDNYNIKCFDHSDSNFIDVGKPESIAEAEMLFE